MSRTIRATFVCNGRTYRAPAGPTLAICIDGTDPTYISDALDRGTMPRLEAALAAGGRLFRAQSQIPTLTNVNNASIITGVSAALHGISGNHYLAPNGNERQLTDTTALRAETILAAAKQAGVAVLAVSAKEKLRALLGKGWVPSISAERADQQTLDGLGGASGEEILGQPRPDIYDPALSAYALDLTLALAQRLGTSLAYCSLTDYVQHNFAPGDRGADRYLAEIDERLGRALAAGWKVGLVADHGMNAKTEEDGGPNVRYLSDALLAAGHLGARVILPITDPYVVHHGALGSLAYVYLESEARPDVRAVLAGLPGVEAVLDRGAAAIAFELPEDRIGDLVVCADAKTVLGKSEADHDLTALHSELRSHGGLREREVPLVVCQPLDDTAVPARGLRNADLFALLLADSRDTENEPAAVSSDPQCSLCAAGLQQASAMIIEQDEHTISLMHPQPATRGHALVVPRRHSVDLHEASAEDLAATITAAQRLATKLCDRLGAEGINLINACGPAAWQTIFHFHLHVVPRYGGDGLQPPWTPRSADRGEIEAVAALLRD